MTSHHFKITKLLQATVQMPECTQYIVSTIYRQSHHIPFYSRFLTFFRKALAPDMIKIYTCTN